MLATHASYSAPAVLCPPLISIYILFLSLSLSPSSHFGRRQCNYVKILSRGRECVLGWLGRLYQRRRTYRHRQRTAT